jgi:hypothetical protein
MITFGKMGRYSSRKQWKGVCMIRGHGVYLLSVSVSRDSIAAIVWQKNRHMCKITNKCAEQRRNYLLWSRVGALCNTRPHSGTTSNSTSASDFWSLTLICDEIISRPQFVLQLRLSHSKIEDVYMNATSFRTDRTLSSSNSFETNMTDLLKIAICVVFLTTLLLQGKYHILPSVAFIRVFNEF